MSQAGRARRRAPSRAVLDPHPPGPSEPTIEFEFDRPVVIRITFRQCGEIRAAAVRRSDDPEVRLDLFLSELTFKDPRQRVQSSRLLEALNSWAVERELPMWSDRALSIALARRGFRKLKSNAMFWVGLGLKPRPRPPQVRLRRAKSVRPSLAP